MTATIIQPVKVNAVATATGIIIVGAVVIAVAATMLGIEAAASNVSYQDECNACWNELTQEAKDGVTAVQNEAGKWYLHFSKLALVQIGTILTAHFKTDSAQTLSNLDLMQKYGMSQYTQVMYYGFPSIYDKMYFIATAPGMMVGSSTPYTYYFGNHITLTIQNPSSTAGYVLKVDNDVIISGAYQNSCAHSESNVPQYAFTYTDSGKYYLEVFFAYYWPDLQWLGGKHEITETEFNSIMQDYDPGIETVDSDSDSGLYAQGYSAAIHSMDDVYNKISELQGTSDSISAYVGDVVGSLSEINDNVKSWTQADVLQTDLTTEAVQAEDDAYNVGRDTTAVEDPSIPNLRLPSNTILTKFPFCLPWDVYSLFVLFDVEPVAPVWTIPIDINMGLLQLHQSYTYDMNSMGVLDTLLPYFKWFLNISFVLGLIMLTRKIMS